MQSASFQTYLVQTSPSPTTLDDVTSLVQTWVNGATNNGLALMSKNETTIGWRRFASKESTNPANPPRLVVAYRP